MSIRKIGYLSMPPLVHILFPIRETATGGGNQFQKALRHWLRERGWHAENPEDASAFLFNSYQYIPAALAVKRAYPERIFVHRIDGPIRLYNNPDDFRDMITNSANQILADGTIFQSEWSRTQNYRWGLKPSAYQMVIPNAPDRAIFYPDGDRFFSRTRKTRLIASSWSANWNKGFDIYKWLDGNLDFSKYEMTFVGNSPISFQNIRHLPPMASWDLSELLRSHDICIFASGLEACSNTILEALHCGLPVIARNGTSNPEVLGTGGELFNRPEEIPSLLENIVEEYASYQSRIQIIPFEEIASRYYEFMRSIHATKEAGRYTPKKLSFFNQLRLQCILMWWKVPSRLRSQWARVSGKVLK